MLIQSSLNIENIVGLRLFVEDSFQALKLHNFPSHPPIVGLVADGAITSYSTLLAFL